MAPQIFAFIVSYPSTSVRITVHFRDRDRSFAALQPVAREF